MRGVALMDITCGVRSKALQETLGNVSQHNNRVVSLPE
jgi:hypothetical protein